MPLLRDATLGIDFGTSNSAMAVRQRGEPARLLALEGPATGLPTALFFNTEDHRTHFGRDAVEQYLTGTEGRLMRSLKSLLGSALLQDKTVVHNTAVSYQDIIALFLQMLAQQARAALGGLPERVVLGRPVHFVDDNPARDQQAQAALGQAARDAGFGEVSFQLEPIAAALDYEQRITQETLVLVVDIGGGTSDFTVVRLDPKRVGQTDRSADVLATTGVHIGGTDFDRKLSQARVMPLLGLGHIGPHGREVPSKVFHDLSTWHLIQWLYAPQALREAQALRSDYSQPALHARLMAVLNQRLGHRVAEAVEQAKIGVSVHGHATPVQLDWVEPDLQGLLSPHEMEHDLQALLAQVVACARACLQLAGLSAQGKSVDAIYLTGGSSALRPLRRAFQQAFPDTPQIEGDLFGGVASGLACAGD
ncbi:Hsp70 family protein [Simplicispira psychrophila]|uniref:Hsp70 family protein n=1 Tax=Simplicispira psychrophila TaxID=80882 RepID=UPI000488E5E5|nr:Hsp70 family protein [Simplicispira psychrophila]